MPLMFDYSFFCGFFWATVSFLMFFARSHEEHFWRMRILCCLILVGIHVMAKIHHDYVDQYEEDAE